MLGLKWQDSATIVVASYVLSGILNRTDLIGAYVRTKRRRAGSKKQQFLGSGFQVNLLQGGSFCINFAVQK